MPVGGAGGLVFPDGGERPEVRDYTPRRFDAAARELTIEFVLHGDGPASGWAARAAPGQWIGVGGPRGSRLLPEDYDAYLLAGDETALPAIARRLEEMCPGARAVVLIEVADAAEERYLPTAANASVTWLHRNGVPAGTGGLLRQALSAVILPGGTSMPGSPARSTPFARCDDIWSRNAGFRANGSPPPATGGSARPTRTRGSTERRAQDGGRRLR